jgi:hypothetical protein
MDCAGTDRYMAEDAWAALVEALMCQWQPIYAKKFW